MKHITMILPTLLLLHGCANSTDEEVKNEEEGEQEQQSETFYENPFYQIVFEGWEEKSIEGTNGFSAHFTVFTQDERRELRPEDVRLAPQEDAADDQGHSYPSSVDDASIEEGEQSNELNITLFYESFINREAELIKLPISFQPRPETTNHQVTFEDITDEELPITHDDVMISDFEQTGSSFSLEAFDLHSLQDAGLWISFGEEVIYPSHSTTEFDNDGQVLNGEYEFAVDLPESFTLHLERRQTREINWSHTFSFSPQG
ncbi:hypothetical protein [Salsuginibacillus kocurii]|uniref:hypothetical protein n=1 Tax=Salsuginibacillus kocurii TaxID=427078 RepID=UPI00037D8E09|nr:hypothetical protein [Salsuginibacillus kocurii]